ncbi:MAG TPA: RNA polymerase recycling motor HelD, partial [Ruminiclostridium sp.]|nr:RNA polymerase recycling motor HelD [Ruminiclostridium sp.]
MLTNKETLEYERMRLEKVVNEIKLQLDIGSDAVRNYKREAIDLQKKMWEDVRCAPTDLSDLEAPAQIWQYQVEIANQARKYKFSSDKVGRLERMLQSPYFGRIDFIEDGEEKAEQIYIGICSLTTGKTREILVYDWRAPIAGMFYDFEIGLAGYDCPGGSITGQMLLKRQYKIEYSDIIYMFDSSLSINDEMLREILGKSTDNRMKTIVTSIQREQNTVIRNSQDRILIVEGPAGSGKTSIALHRAAYLLYKFRDSIKSENILVFSPNHVFEDYISNVLPELGEENIQRSTFTSFFADMFDAKYRIESMNQQMEYILSVGANELRLRGIEFKSSQQFLEILRNYVKHLENAMSLHFKDIVYNNRLVVSAEDIYQLFRSDYNRFFYAKRLEKLRQRLFYLLEQCEEMRVQENQALTEEEKVLADMKSKQELGNLRNSITQMTFFDIYTLYKDLFENIGSFAKTADKQQLEELHDIGVFTICQLNRNTINYEDAAPIIFLKTALDTAGGTKSIKHA